MTSGPFTNVITDHSPEDFSLNPNPSPTVEPVLGDVFNAFYDQYSILLSSFTIPDHCASYLPDNNDDGACRVVIAPEPSLGAQRWTFREKWITIGIYRDEGRPASYDVNGNLVNFYEDYVVFRLLPSFKLVPYAVIQDLLASSVPVPTMTKRTMVEITTGVEIKVPSTVSKHTNYRASLNPAVDNTSLLPRRFNQLYDETGAPMKLTYDALGYALQSLVIDSKYKNNPVQLNATVDGATVNPRVYAYDYYGVDLNDPLRGPFFTSSLVSRDLSIDGNVDNIKRLTTVYGDTLYSGGIYDEFGNIAVGVQENNALTVRQNVMPLTLDQFNHPVKSPLAKSA